MKSRPAVWRYPSAFLTILLFTCSSALAAWQARPGTIKVVTTKRPPSPSQPQRPFPPGVLSALQAELVEDHEAFAVLQMPLPNASAAPQLLRREIGDVVQILDDFDILGFLSYPIDARLPEPAYPALWRKQTHLPSPARDAFVLQFASSPRQAWIDELRSAGAAILESVSHHGYVVLGDHVALQAVVNRLPIQQFRIHQPVHRASLAAREASGLFADVVVSIANVPEAVDAVSFLAGATLEQLRPPEPSGDRTVHYVRFATPALPQLAALPAVIWVDLHYTDVRPSGQREANLTIGDTLVATSPLRPLPSDHRGWITSRNLHNYPSQVKMAILDTGFDNALGDGPPASFHSDFRKSDGSGTFIANVKKYSTEPGSTSNADCSGHGTFVAGVLAGNAGVSGITTTVRDCPGCPDGQFLMGLGIVPEVPLVVGRVFNYLSAPGPYGFQPQDFVSIFSNLASQQVAITSNSWNASDDRSYDARTRDLEMLVRSASGANYGPPMAIYQSAGNRDDPPFTTSSITWPAFAKNLITVGASEGLNPSTYSASDPNYRPETAYDHANDGNDVWIWTRQGPIEHSPAEALSPNRRVKPDLVAPGSGMESPLTRSTAFDTTSCTVNPSQGELGRVRPVGAVIDATPQEGHLWSRGTSFSTPVAAGAGALLYTWFKNKGETPRPSLLKAAQITLARRLTGNGTGSPPDIITQGWGKVDLTGLPDSLPASSDPYEWSNENPTKIVTPEQRTAYLPSADSGYRILDLSQPVRVSLVWTDAPGPTQAGRKLVNDLDLKVVIHGNGGQFALGNNFNGTSGISSIFVSGVTSGSPDTRNNVEQVVFMASDVGNSNLFHVEVFGRDIPVDGIGVWTPGGPIQQDFSVFIQNAAAYINNAAVTAEDVPVTTVPAGGSFTASFTLQNTGESLWSAAQGFKLGSIVGKAFGAEIPLNPGETVLPNASRVFSLNVIAPYAAGTYPFQWRMFDPPVQFGSPTQYRTITVTPVGRSFYTVQPCRVFDTRETGMGGPLLHGVERVFMVRGPCGIPAAATAVAANLTVVGPAAPGHLVTYPPNIGPPATSAMNFNAGQTRANNAILTLDTQGQIGVMPAGNTHLLFDVTGYFQ